MTAPPPTADLSLALRARDRERVNREAARLLADRVALGGQWFDIARVLVANLEVGLALEAGQRALDELGNSASARFRHAELLAEVGRPGEALGLLTDEVARAVPNPLEYDHFTGTCAMQTGDVERARAAFDRVVARWPGAGAAWLSLAALPAEDDAALLKRLRSAQASMAAARAGDRAQYHYALGAVLDRLGESDDAFTEFSGGARIVAAQRPYDASADVADADRLIGEAEHVAKLSKSTGEPSPIFVIGLPRSGTTLVEHILSRHDEIAGGDELGSGAIVVQEARSGAAENRKAAQRLASLYRHFGSERFGPGRRFVDKSVDNSRRIGLLAALLPDAPILWVRRDPLNCAWSCFRTYFSSGVEWSWSLADIAAHFRIEDRLYRRWREMLGDRLLTVDYEQLVTDTDALTDRMFAHVGLDRPAEGSDRGDQRPVSTASMVQVRQPIYRSSIDAAERYRAHLTPFIDAYSASAD